MIFFGSLYLDLLFPQLPLLLLLEDSNSFWICLVATLIVDFLLLGLNALREPDLAK